MPIEVVARQYGVDVADMMGHLHKTAETLNLPVRNIERVYNSRKAQELGLWAQSQGQGVKFHLAVFQAYFVDNKNIARLPVLLHLAEVAGLSCRAAQEVIETGAFAAAVDADWSVSREKEIRLAPTFAINDAKLVGAKPYPIIQKFAEKNKAKYRIVN